MIIKKSGMTNAGSCDEQHCYAECFTSKDGLNLVQNPGQYPIARFSLAAWFAGRVNSAATSIRAGTNNVV